MSDRVRVRRMTRIELEDEVLALRAPDQPFEAKSRIRMLEQRDKERAAELAKLKAHARLMERVASEAREAKDAAERNAAQWHALLLQERIRKL